MVCSLPSHVLRLPCRLWAETPTLDGTPWPAPGARARPKAAAARPAPSGSEWGLLLSKDWYGNFEFSGKVATSGSRPVLAALIRYAGPSESYAVALDWQSSRLSLEENHFGESREVVTG
jgi:hypothetical protein